jgi:hypothetical protein
VSAVYVSSYCTIYVSSTVYMCPHTTAAVSGMYVCPLYVCPHAALYICPHAKVCQEGASRELALRIVRLLVN